MRQIHITRTAGLSATMLLLGIPLTAPVPAANAKSLPRIYSTVAQHGEQFSNVFAVRPREIIVDSADGGELKIRWTSWTSTSASGYGRAFPDHGSYPIAVNASDVIAGQLTHLTIKATGPGHNYGPDRLELATDGTMLTWARISWVENPESGLMRWAGN